MQRGCSVRHIFQANISFSQIAPGHRIKQRQNFLCNSQNKTRLIEFLVSDWSLERLRKKLKGKDVYVTVGEICKHLTECDGVWSWRLEVYTWRGRHENAPPRGPLWHEEADTRMLLHAVHCGTTGSRAVAVVSEDTNVFIVSVLHPRCLVPCMLNVVQRQGHNTSMCRNWFRCLGLSNVVLCQAYMLSQVVILYVLLLAEENSRVFVWWARLLNTWETLTLLGSHWDLTDDLYKRLESLTCQLYCAILNVESVNELHNDIFFAKKGEIESWQLPPCSSSLLFFTSKPLQKGKLSMCNLEEELGSIHSSEKSCWHGMVHGPW